MTPPRICPACDRLKVARDFEGRLCKVCIAKAARPPKICPRCEMLCKATAFDSPGGERKRCALCRMKAREDAERRKKREGGLASSGE